MIEGWFREPTLAERLGMLQIGETHVFTEEPPTTIRRIATRLQKRHKGKYVCRSTPDGYQVWRTA